MKCCNCGKDHALRAKYFFGKLFVTTLFFVLLFSTLVLPFVDKTAPYWVKVVFPAFAAASLFFHGEVISEINKSKEDALSES